MITTITIRTDYQHDADDTNSDRNDDDDDDKILLIHSTNLLRPNVYFRGGVVLRVEFVGSLLQEVFLRVLRFSPLHKNQYLI